MEKSKKIFLIFTAAFLGCVLLVGIIFGTVSIVRNARSVMSYKGIYLNKGVANYLSASYKYDFISTLGRSGIKCTDDDAFWQSDAGDGKTYGDILKESTEKHLKSILVGNYLFDRNTRLTKDDKNTINKSVEEVLEYRFYGDVDHFNEVGEPMGFDYRDFKKAATLLYKSQMAQSVIFGFDGSALASGNFSTECEEYFQNNYSRVKLLIIRTDGKLVTNEETGKQELLEYTKSERDAALAKIDEIKSIINNGQMNEDAFTWHITNEYPTNTVNDTEGYYFSPSSAYSLNFARQGGLEIVRLALSMKEGTYDNCKVTGDMEATCFIYKCTLEPGAYARYTISHFFEDFYSNAAPYIYAKSIEVYLPDVKVNDKYDSTAVLSQPCNKDLPIEFW